MVENDPNREGRALVKLTPLRLGSTIDLIVNDLDANNGIELVFSLIGGQEVVTIPLTLTNGDEASDMFHTVRQTFVTTGLNVVSSIYNSNKAQAFEISNDAASFRDRSSELDALCKDMEGQASEAVSSEAYYERWGQHFLFSLLGAHLHQFCNNFKDPGVQVYGNGQLFISLQDDLNDIFGTIPPPTPTAQRYYGRNRNCQQIGQSMAATFNNKNAVCFHGKVRVTVKLQDSTLATVSICQLKRNDLVLTEDGDFALVECLIETITNTPLDLVQIDSLQITPYHPIKQGTEWEFPIDCNNRRIVRSDSYSVFNLILERKSRHKAIMVEDSFVSITLGHGRYDNATLKHEYFGTELIVQDLQKFETGWSIGHVTLREEDILRTNNMGNICCIKKMKEEKRSSRVSGLTY